MAVLSHMGFCSTHIGISWGFIGLTELEAFCTYITQNCSGGKAERDAEAYRTRWRGCWGGRRARLDLRGCIV